MRHSPLQQIYIFEVVLQADLQLTEIVVQTESLKLNLKNDAALSRALEVRPPVISKIRHRTLPVGASLLIRMHEVTDLSIRELRELMGDRRKRLRISEVDGKPRTIEDDE